MNPPPIPPRSSSKPAFLLPQESIERIREKRSRIVSTSNAMSGLSTVSNVSDYLEKKLLSLQSEAEYHQCVQEELRHAKSTEILDAQDYDSQMESVDEELKPIWSEVRVLKRQKRLTEQEMEDNVQIIKRRNLNIAPSIELLERAYTTTMLTRVMSACKQKKRNFNQSQFRKDVIERYDAAFLKSHGGYALVWCHLTEWHPPEVIKAAHLVPKNLRGGELLHIFGEDEVVLSDPANGLTFHKNIEGGLDNGTIAIVPMPPFGEEYVTIWKCILVKNELKNREVMVSIIKDDVKMVTWGELDGKELKFRSTNRPARRYLYFRFIMTYLNAKKDGNMQWVEKVESRKVLWASPGPYLEKSTLLALGRNISGLELPPSLYEENTFDGEEAPQDELGMLAADLRTALITSNKDENEDEEEEEDDEEDDDCQNED